MSRSNDGTVVPMSQNRRADITRELRNAAGCMAPFEGERLVVSCIRYDGGGAEIVCVLHVERDHTTVIHEIQAPTSSQDQGEKK